MRLQRSFGRAFVIGLIICAGLLTRQRSTLAQAGSSLWTFNFSDAVLASPAIGSDGAIYVGSVD